MAIPIFKSFFTIILSPSTELLSIGYFFNDFTTASTNKGVKVIFSPSLFSNSFLIFSLHCTRFVTSHSAKLVTCALVATLSVMCLDISLRIRSISITSTLPLYTTGVLFAGATTAGAFVITTACWLCCVACAG